MPDVLIVHCGSGPVRVSQTGLHRVLTVGLAVWLAALGSRGFDPAEPFFWRFTLESRALQPLAADFLYRFCQPLFSLRFS
jgi:hypothetical protein